MNEKVLDKVKGLMSLPNTELMTAEMVADYFEVTMDNLQELIRRNRDELIENGMSSKSYGELVEIVREENKSFLKRFKKGTTIFYSTHILNEISKICHEINEPIFITRNGANDLVVLSDETYKKITKDSIQEIDEIRAKL